MNEEATFGGVVITFQVEDTPAGKAVQTSIEGYGRLIALGFDVPKLPDRDIVVITDRSEYETLTGNDTTGLAGQMSRAVPGQYTIFVSPEARQIGQVAVHEVMHITHPGIGAGQPHHTEFYVRQEQVLSELGLDPYRYQSVAGAGIYNEHGGSQLEQAIAKYGLSDVQVDILTQIYSDVEMFALSEALKAQYGEDFGLSEKVPEINKFQIDRCFPSGTLVLLGNGEEKMIEQIAVGDEVLCFDPLLDQGRGGLVSSDVVRLFRNVTDRLIKLDFGPDRDPVFSTPEHYFLDETGSFTQIGDLMRLGGGSVTLVDEDGQLQKARGEEILYSQETAGLFHSTLIASENVVGGISAADHEEGWITYNFEVATHHTYVAGGIRVHNDSNSETTAIVDDTGKVYVYENAYGEVGVTGDGYVNKKTLDHYGFVDDEGNARVGFWNSLKALADGIGLDGKPGIQGNFGDKDGKGDNEPAKPVIIDLDGDGVEVSTNPVSFDWDDDGYLENGAWAAADDGFLVIDLNADGTIGDGDGKIDQAKELAFALWGPEGATDLQALAQATDDNGDLLFDSNGDGVLNDQDNLWSNFNIWQDLDQDMCAANQNRAQFDNLAATRA